MEYLFEFILECVLEGSIEVSKSSKVPKYIRYPLILIIALFCAAVIGSLLFAGVFILKESILAGILLICIRSLMLIMGIIKFRKVYLSKKK